MLEADEDMVLEALALPAEMDAAPVWARALFKAQRKHERTSNAELAKLTAEVGRLTNLLGSEPQSDGSGGSGLIGDLRSTARDVAGLKSLKTLGTGFVSALTVFGALIFMGVQEWISNIVGALKQ